MKTIPAAQIFEQHTNLIKLLKKYTLETKRETMQSGLNEKQFFCANLVFSVYLCNNEYSHKLCEIFETRPKSKLVHWLLEFSHCSASRLVGWLFHVVIETSYVPNSNFIGLCTSFEIGCEYREVCRILCKLYCLIKHFAKI